jgi:hypothetical protein
VHIEDLGRIVPILERWAPLLRSLSQSRGRDDAQWAQFFNAIGPPKKPQTPEPVRLADRYVWPEPRLCSRQRRTCEFYRVGGSGRYCSDGCSEASWRASRAVRNTAMAKSRSEALAAARTATVAAAHRKREGEKFSRGEPQRIGGLADARTARAA